MVLTRYRQRQSIVTDDLSRCITRIKLGGDMRDRTADLKLAKLPLSQLSYVPKNFGRPASGSFKDRFLPPSKLSYVPLKLLGFVLVKETPLECIQFHIHSTLTPI